jgi:purine-nucleoside phosphorylase
MTRFEVLFGLKEAQIKRNCVLVPFLQKGILERFRIKNFSRGRLYGAGNSDRLTVIHTGMGAGLVGDAVLYLKGTPCRNIILFGSCGLVSEKDNLSIGSLIVPSRCYAKESFSELLLEPGRRPKIFYPHKKLLEGFLSYAKGPNVIQKAACATVGSLKLEEDMANLFFHKGVEIVDMECSAFFCASRRSKFKALAFFYASDIIKVRPFYTSLGPYLRSRISVAINDGVNLLRDFIDVINR